ncbi:MAG: hypothetical protein IPN70_00005 [Candidatus Moraniibacteriota bacterium]|nr:MAG: hypothetical protein IPN70_00005 [Candidatus Moranbacteria bacterium]
MKQKKEKNLNYKISTLAFFLFLFLNIFSVSAQTLEPKDFPREEFDRIKAENPEMIQEMEIIRIASVNVYNPVVVSKEGTSIEVAYDINNREGIQTDIITSLLLLNKEGIPLFQNVFKDPISLKNDETKKIIQKLELPFFPNGTYDIGIEVSNSSGLTLAQSSIKDVEIAGITTGYVKIESCRLTINKEEKVYSPSEGIDVLPVEELYVSCFYKSTFLESVTVKPEFTEYRRSLFGEALNVYKRDSFVLEPNKEKEVSFLIEKNTLPQSYTQNLVLKDESNKIISTEAQLHYVVSGESATIQNIVFDKESYTKGETANVSFGWTGSADQFLGARNKTKIAGTAYLEISDAQGVCAKEVEAPFDSASGSGYEHKAMNIEITKNCTQPTIRVVVKNKEGKTLDERSVSANTEEKQEGISYAGISQKTLLISLLALLSGFLAFIVLKKSRRRKGIVSLFAFFLGVNMFFVAQDVSADTFVFTVTNTNFVVTANHNKNEYSPNENATTTTTIKAIACNNGWMGLSAELWLTSPQSKKINTWLANTFINSGWSNCTFAFNFYHDHYRCTSNGVGTFNVGTSATYPSTKNANYKLDMVVYDGYNQYQTGTFSIPYSIVSEKALAVSKSGTGSGLVTSAPSGINCGADCSQNYNTGTTVTLTASPLAGSTFSSWTGCDSVNGATCTVTMNAAKTVTARFNLIPTCTGTRPANTTVYSGDTTGLTANVSYTYSAINTAPKCQYYCNTGYTWNGSACVLPAYSCTGTRPANTVIYDGDTINLTQNIDYLYHATGTARKCEYRCNTGYTWNGSACVLPAYSCTGTRPANTVIYDGDTINLTQNIDYLYHATGTARKCEYRCNTGYTWNGSACVLPAYSCTGTRPLHTTVYSGDETGLTANTSYVYSATDTTPKCQYYCNSGYTWNGSACSVDIGKCNEDITDSCYEGNLYSIRATICSEGDLTTMQDPKYASGVWTWTCRGGIRDAFCTTNQCARYEEVAP